MLKNELDPDSPFWTKEDFARAVPFSGLPEGLQVKLRAIQEKSAAGKSRVDEILQERLVE